MSKCLLAPSVNSKVPQLQNLRNTKFWILLTDYAPSKKKTNELVAIWQNIVSQTYYSWDDIVCFSSMKFEVHRERNFYPSKTAQLCARLIIFQRMRKYQFCDFCESCDALRGIGKGPSRSEKQEQQVIKLGFRAIWWGEGDEVPTVPNVPKAPLTSSRNHTW